MGNRRSVEKALLRIGAPVVVSGDPDRIAGADGLVLPGVGAFGQAMANLERLKLPDPIRAAVRSGTPLLGICLGMQLLFDASEELGEHRGLGLLPGAVRRLAAGPLRVPHIGWSDVRFVRDSPLTLGLPARGAPFYHVHSYAVHPQQEADVIGTTSYGTAFPTIVGRGVVFGVQFHPEKSSRDGLALLAAFASLCERDRAAVAA